jgi:hypothetical protein
MPVVLIVVQSILVPDRSRDQATLAAVASMRPRPKLSEEDRRLVDPIDDRLARTITTPSQLPARRRNS